MSSLPETARAAVVTSFGAPVRVQELPLPAPMEPGAVLVRVEVASVCGTDVHLWQGALTTGAPVQLPVVLGHEMVGTVVAFGEGPRADSVGEPLIEGDRILWTHASCGRCRSCTVAAEPTACTGRVSYMRQRADRYPYLTGGFAEYCYVFPGSGRLRVPDAVTSARASASSCALRTVIHAFEQLAGVEAHERLVIQGAGPLGLFATAVAHHAGVQDITVIGDPPSRLELARAYGATRVVGIDDWEQAGPADVLIECSGAPAAFAQGLRLAGPTARYAVVGQVGGEPVSVAPGMIVGKQLTIHGTLSGHARHYWKALCFLAITADRYDWDAMLTGRYPLEGVTDALRSMGGEQIKPLVLPWD